MTTYTSTSSSVVEPNSNVQTRIVYVKDAITHKTHPIALSSPALFSMENVLQRSGSHYHQYSFTDWNDILISPTLLTYLDEHSLLCLSLINRDCVNTLRAHPIWLTLPSAKYVDELFPEDSAASTSSSPNTNPPFNTSRGAPPRKTNIILPRQPSVISYARAFYIRRMLAYRNQAERIWKRIDTYYRIHISTEWNEGIHYNELRWITKELQFLLHPSLVGSLILRNGNIRDRDIVTNHMAMYGARLLSGEEIVRYKQEQPIPPGLYLDTSTVSILHTISNSPSKTLPYISSTVPSSSSIPSIRYTVPISAVFGHKQLWMDSKIGTVFLCQPLHDPIVIASHFVAFLETTLQ